MAWGEMLIMMRYSTVAVRNENIVYNTTISKVLLGTLFSWLSRPKNIPVHSTKHKIVSQTFFGTQPDKWWFLVLFSSKVSSSIKRNTIWTVQWKRYMIFKSVHTRPWTVLGSSNGFFFSKFRIAHCIFWPREANFSCMDIGFLPDTNNTPGMPGVFSPPPTSKEIAS